MKLVVPSMGSTIQVGSSVSSVSPSSPVLSSPINLHTHTITPTPAVKPLGSPVGRELLSQEGEDELLHFLVCLCH